MFQVSGYIEVELPSRNLAVGLAKALKVEAENPPDPGRGRVVIEVKDNRILIKIQARDLPAARTLFTTYLALMASTLDAVIALKETNKAK